ncbi:SHQ1 protein-domain-containing protein [Geranomyces variabilis]|nr:SHQ1 protein-domain-containing protein [Geranomyces variabilis]KAJ3142132.1 Hsp90 cochaperone shq1 [Geranomyces variabilis]
MLTPAFSISQNDEFVTVVLKCPYIKTQDVEFYINDNEFKFYVKPYFLRLTFPEPIVEDGREKASYDVDKGEITVALPKATKGQHFADLDFLTKLMAPKGGPGSSAVEPGLPTDSQPLSQPPSKPKAGPLIEVIGESGTESADMMDQDNDEVDDDADDGQNYHWDYPQESLPQPELQTTARYGFNNAHSGYGSHIQEIAYEILDVTDLETSTPASRREQRLFRENLKFDDEHYMADFLNSDEIKPLLDFRPSFWKALKRVQKLRAVDPPPSVEPVQVVESTPSNVLPDLASMSITPAPINEPWLTFSEEEQQQMRSLPNKEYLLDDERATYLGLVDILFAYAYNHRTTEGDSTVESPWTVAKLSPTLSCFETFHSLQESLTACVRRSLAYPLYRSYALALRCIEDVAVLFKLGKRAILKALLEVRSLVAGDDRMYVLGRVWLDDYCVWIQRASDKRLQSLASELNHATVTKEQIDWDLEQLEKAARDGPPPAEHSSDPTEM